VSRRVAAALVLAAASASCGHGGPAGPAGPVPAGGEPLIRVGIVVDRDSASVSANGQYRLVTADGGVVAVVDGGRTWLVRTGSEAGQLVLERPDRDAPVEVAAPVALLPERENDLVVVNGRSYRGHAVLQRGTAGLTVVNRVPLEAYLRSVVALELGFRGQNDRQAVMAQAVAARSYALRYRGRREALGFDVFPTDADQVYGGTEAEKPEVSEAVERTRGQALLWEGRPIEALFHSTCGWSTEASSEVFQNRAVVPYLRAVSDRTGAGSRDFYCAASPRFRWREEWDGAGLAAVLSRTLPAALGGRGGEVTRVTDVRAGRTTPTGRVAELVVATDAGEFTVPAGRVRDVLRPAIDRQLNSTLFQLHVEREGGAVRRLVAAGAGYGHGVGMCQFGAVGRSRAGQDYQAILSAYYHGSTLERLY
jgi:stage II sporulation protein D